MDAILPGAAEREKGAGAGRRIALVSAGSRIIRSAQVDAGRLAAGGGRHDAEIANEDTDTRLACR
jgi:hypothetical protein